MAEQPPNETAPALVTAAEVRAELETLLADRGHLGLRNLLGDVFLERRNPVQPARRKPKPWVAAASAMLVLGLLIAGFFRVA